MDGSDTVGLIVGDLVNMLLSFICPRGFNLQFRHQGWRDTNRKLLVTHIAVAFCWYNFVSFICRGLNRSYNYSFTPHRCPFQLAHETRNEHPP